jgi:hypothetical protein
MKTRSILFVAALAAIGCKKNQEQPAASAKPTAAETAATAAAATDAPKLASTVKLTVDPKGGFGTTTATLDLSGQAIFFANKQPDGDFTYELMFFPAGISVTCETALPHDTPIPGGVALDVDIKERGEAPKAGMELAGTFELHFTHNNKHTTAGLHQGAKVKLSAVTDKTVTGELSGSTGSDSVVGGSGTFTALFCKWGDADSDAQE